MSIPASQIVQVSPRLMTPGGDDLQFNGLMLTSSEVMPMSALVKAFSSAEDVGAYFGPNSREAGLASVYFAGYDDSFRKPETLLFAPRAAEARAAFARGGAVTPDWERLAELSETSMELVFGGEKVTVTADVSSARTASELAAAVQQAVRASGGGEAFSQATCAYSSAFGAFTVTSGVTGADESAAWPEGELAEIMGLTEELGDALSPGSEAMTPEEIMTAVTRETQNFVCFMSVDKLSGEDALGFSRWASAQGVEYLHVYWDDDPALTRSEGADTLARAMKDAALSSTCGVYGGAEYAAFVLGAAASVDYDRVNGAITFKFKGQSGLAANVRAGSEASALEANGMNFVGDYATRNDNFVFFSPGQMFGDYRWIDAYLNAVWLNNALQVACVNGFAKNGRVPYTEEGYALVRAWMQDPINRALKSGVIEPGVSLSESQKAQLQREAGLDISGQLDAEGYVLQVLDPAPATRQQRGTPQCSLWYAYGGSIHKLDIASTAVV